MLMKQFVKKVLFFYGLVIVSTTLVIVLTIKMNRKMFSRVILDNNISTLIMGDSHTIFEINGSLFPNTQNISKTAEGYIFSYLKLRSILNNNSQIKNIILGVSYHNLSAYYDDYIYGNDSYYSISQFIALMELEEILYLLRLSPSSQNMKSILQNSLKNIYQYKRNQYPFISGTNISRAPQSIDNQIITNTINNQYYSKKQGEISEINVRFLKQIVDLCRAKNVQITFLNTPLYKDYLAKVPPEILMEYKTIVRDLDVAVIDLSTLNLSQDCFFPDGEHMSYKGALQMSEYLGKLVESSTEFHGHKD